jgi:hypothetical protein
MQRRRSEDGLFFSTQLNMAEVAPPFTGAFVGARATVEYPASVSLSAPPVTSEWPHEFNYSSLGELHFWDATGTAPDASTRGWLRQLVANGEIFFIRFDFKGPNYACLRHDAGGNTFFLISLPSGAIPRGTQHVAPPGDYAGLTYEITRSPSQSIVSPLTLPGDTIIDLTVSGVGLGQHAHAFDYERPSATPPDPPAPVIIMFSPNGQVGFVYVDNIAKTPTGPIYLLIGRRAKILNPTAPTSPIADPELSNLADAENLWVTVNNRTGSITTEDNDFTADMSAAATLAERIRQARQFARGSRQKGGR